MVEKDVSVRLAGKEALLFLKESFFSVTAINLEEISPCFKALMIFLFFVLVALNSAQPMIHACKGVHLCLYI